MLYILLFVFFLALLIMILLYVGYSIKKGKFINWGHNDRAIKDHKLEFVIWLLYISVCCLFLLFVLVVIASRVN